MHMSRFFALILVVIYLQIKEDFSQDEVLRKTNFKFVIHNLI